MGGLAEALSLATLVVLSAAMPLALVAVVGFRGTPFGSVLKPLPVTFGAYVLMNAAQVLGVGLSPSGLLLLSGVAVLAAFASALNATLVLTERRAL